MTKNSFLKVTLEVGRVYLLPTKHLCNINFFNLTVMEVSNVDIFN